MNKIGNFFKRYEWLGPFLVMTVIIFAYLYDQVINHSMLIFNDTPFHFGRFWEVHQQIATGKISYFQSNFSFNQSGRIINAVYGPLFALIMGSLTFIFTTWFRFQIGTSILLIYLAGFGFYKMAKETEQVSLPFLNLGLFIFLELGYIPAWIQGQSMMAGGGAIVPWVLRYGIRMIKLKKDQINVIGLAVSMAIAAQTHNLTVAMLILALTPAFIVAFVKSNEKKKLFRDVIFSVIIFLFLSANIIGALLVLKTNNIAMPVPIDLKGIALNITPNLVQRNHITPLMLIVLIITAGLAIINFNKNKLNFWLGLGGASFFFLSTKAFPWGITERLLPFLKTSFQSPSRLTVIAYPLLLVSLSISLSSIAKRKNLRNIILKWGITGLAVIASISALFDFQAYLHSNTLAYLDNNVVVLYNWVYKVPKSRTIIREDMMSRNQGKLFQDLANSEPDYLPITKKIDSGQIVNIYGQKVVKNTDNFVRKVNKDGSLSLIWKQKKAGKKLLPIVMYKQSTLFLNRKKDRYKFESVAIPVVQARKGMNIATLKFNSPIWFIILLWISIISWIALIIYKGWMFCSKKRKFLQ